MAHLPNSRIARDSESVVRVLKFRRDAGSCRAARDFDVMTPGTSPGRLTGGLHRAPFRPAGIPFGSEGIVIRIVPVATPFMDVVAHVVQAECAGCILGDRLRAVLPTTGVIGKRCWRFISPRELLLFKTSPCGAFPLSLGWKAELVPGLRAQPVAVTDGFVPGDSRHRLLRMVEVRMLPEWRHFGRTSAQKSPIFCIRDLRRGETKRIDPDAMDRAFRVLAGFGAHQKPARGNRDQGRLESDVSGLWL
jgi:hypothetical protein